MNVQATFRFGNDFFAVDLFAGGGGASEGIRDALGVPPALAVNHDPAAIAMHELNHPETEHMCASVFEVDPVAACRGRTPDLLWAPPDCTHHSRAKGGKPRDKNIRALAWVVGIAVRVPSTVTLTADVAAKWPAIVDAVQRQSGVTRMPTTAEVMRALVAGYLQP